MTVARMAFVGWGMLLAVAAPAAAQSSLAIVIPSPVDHPVFSPATQRTPYSWRKHTGGWGETFVDETLRLRGYNEVLEIKGPGDQGIDRLALKYGPGGKLSDVKIVEVKTHRGTRARLSSTRRGRQLSRTWLAEKFKMMRVSGDPRLRQLAREVSQFRRERGLTIERLGELHDVNTRTGRYVRREPLTGRELSSDSIDRFFSRMQNGRVSSASMRWLAATEADWDQIRSTSESLWTGRSGIARAQLLGSATDTSVATALRPAAGRSLRRFARVAGPFGAAAAVAMDAHEVYSQVAAYRRGEISRRAVLIVAARSSSGVAGATAGATVGAWVGAYGGPVAWVTVPAGAAVGAVVGHFAGSMAARAVAETWYSGIDEKVKQATDAWLVRTPYHQLHSTR